MPGMLISFVPILSLLLTTYTKGFEIRLWQTNPQGTEGFVEVFYNGSWGLVGNPFFRFNDATATLLCKTLNISMFGYGSGHIRMENHTNRHSWLSELECLGNESKIDECVHELVYRNYSGSWYYEYGSRLHCVDYILTGGESQNRGLVLASINNTVQTLCHRGFNMNAANLICNLLQYNGAVDFMEGDPGLVPVYNKVFSCNGLESSLSNCSLHNDVIENCPKAVNIVCRAVRLTNWNKYKDEGAVEVFYNGSWGFVGHLGFYFDNTTSKFLCNIFGFRNGGFSTMAHPLLTYYRKAWLLSLTCNGSESDIMQCKHSTFSVVPSLMQTYKRGTWLYCFDYNITSMQLVNGSKSYEGKVQLQIGRRWGSICRLSMSSQQTESISEFVCRSLGYAGLDTVLTDDTTTENEIYWMSVINCPLNEFNLSACSFIKGPIPFCFYKPMPLVVRCIEYGLTGGDYEGTGRVLATIFDKKYELCYNGFDMNAATVVCNRLRYHGSMGFTYVDRGYIPLFNKRLTCNGNEHSLERCNISSDVIKNCSKAVYITCRIVRLATVDEHIDEGAVEIFHWNSWGYIGYPEYAFDDKTASLFCETLGFGNIGFSIQSFRVQDVQNLTSGLHSFKCNGTESNLMQCQRPEFNFYQVRYPYGTWLCCFDYNITAMRLVNGPYLYKGTVEIEIGGRWGKICGGGLEEGNVICINMGYAGVYDVSTFRNEQQTILMQYPNCIGNETSLMNCSFEKGGNIYQARLLGFLWIHCQDLDQCLSSPCLNEGTCVDGDRSFTCLCSDKWGGVYCELDLEYDMCQEHPCRNNGTCVDFPIGYNCMCAAGFDGANCEIDVYECVSEPCANNGKCEDAKNGYKCSCAPGYVGERCQNDIDECLSLPCEHNGDCINAINGFVCSCQRGYEGSRCQNEISNQTALIAILTSLICILVIAILVTACCCLRYRREQKKSSNSKDIVDRIQGNLQNRDKNDELSKVKKERKGPDEVYDEIKDGDLVDNANYITPVANVVIEKDADGYVKLSNKDQDVRYYALRNA